MDYGAHNFTETSILDITCIEIVPELIEVYIRRYKIYKLNIPLSSFISTGSSTKFLCAKLIPELSLYLSMHL